MQKKENILKAKEMNSTISKDKRLSLRNLLKVGLGIS